MGHSVQVYAVRSRQDSGYDAAAERFVREAEISLFFLSGRLLWANFMAAVCHPIRYWGTLLFILFHSLGQPTECVKSLVVYPKAVYYGALMVRRGVEHIHAHFANIPTLVALVINRICGIPFSFTCHAHDLFQFRSMLAEKLHAAKFAVAISDYNRQFLRRYCAEEDVARVHVVHCGADVRKLAQVDRRPRDGLVVSVARLSPMKGHIYLIEACALLRQRGILVECVIGGGGEERHVLEARVRELGLEDTVRLAGRLPTEEVAGFVSRASVFVLPCIQAPDHSMDGIPVSLMEAMALRVPVICTTVSGIPELIRDGETGLLVKTHDPEALADAIERVITEEGLGNRLAEKGYDLVGEQFDLQKNARRLAALLQEQVQS